LHPSSKGEVGAAKRIMNLPFFIHVETAHNKLGREENATPGIRIIATS
jgi:hypothetical protein